MKTHCKNGHEMTESNAYFYTSKDGYTVCACKTCRSNDMELYRSTHREERTNRSKTDHQRKKRELVLYKGDKCMDCLQSFPDCVYDFEHRDPFQKSFNIGQKLHRPLEELKVEADKCDLVCSNCHRIRTISPLISERKRHGWVKRKERELVTQ